MAFLCKEAKRWGYGTGGRSHGGQEPQEEGMQKEEMEGGAYF